MDLKTDNGMFIISEKDRQIIHEIKHLWQEMHGKYFKIGKLISEVSKKFDELGKP